MSIHPSLRPSKGGGHRSVFKRFERIKILSEKGKWQEGSSVFGLPKVKSIKIRAKKEKAAEAKAATEAPAGTPAASTSAAAKPQAAQAKKEQAKASK